MSGRRFLPCAGASLRRNLEGPLEKALALELGTYATCSAACFAADIYLPSPTLVAMRSQMHGNTTQLAQNAVSGIIYCLFQSWLYVPRGQGSRSLTDSVDRTGPLLPPSRPTVPFVL